MVHTRPVEFLATDIPRSRFSQDLLYTFGAFMTFCRATRNDAERRVRAVLAGHSDRTSLPPLAPDEALDDVAEIRDIERDSRDQILKFVERSFKGHRLATLVAAVLRAQGLVTRESDPGADGGVDILAASGPMGFDSPRLCVQVKSQSTPIDVTVFRGLLGTMDSFDAEQGLLVAWGGFKDTVVREARAAFFRVRLWNADDLLDAIFWNYDKLSEDIKAELPLKRIWALATAEVEE
jgi:restriction system protein